ncbi:protein of unknown function DUF218 [Sphingobacterium sp. JB170]|nr:protein of unknown function DUF218 [Sphingobacterium sp. JB170]
MIVGTCFAHLSFAQGDHKPQTPQDWVLSKNYLASCLLFKNTEIRENIFSDPAIQALLVSRAERYAGAQECEDLACFLAAFKWSDAEMESLHEFMAKRFDSDKELQGLVQTALITSGAYGSATQSDPKAYFVKAIKQDMRYTNYVIDVYAGGAKPNYPRIDSISFDTSKKPYLGLLQDVRQDVLKDSPTPHQAAFMTILTAVRLLEVNERMDAAQLEPIMEGENSKALTAIKTTNFQDYPYSLLLVLGAGPSKYDQPISPGGMLRARMAARAYFDGQAPFIVLSGGRVHPYKTPYIEAIEMKRYLIENLLVPQEAIILDPHARHTTTNLRNTARIMFRYGFPQDQFAMVTSSKVHIDAVVGMADRCIKELGYVPYELGKRMSDVVLEFKPKVESMTIDPDEPLDP